MKRVLAGLLSLTLAFCASASWAASYGNWSGAPTPPTQHSPESLEVPPADDGPRQAAKLRSASSLDDGPRRPHDAFSLTFAPLYLILPMFKMTGEVRPFSHTGVAVFGGLGKTSIDVSANDGSKHTFDANTYLVGAQLIGYPTRNFDGVQVGAQFQYVHVDAQGAGSDSSVAGVATGFAIGPFLGYKYITRVGFTFGVQGGVQYLAIRANAHDQNDSSTDSNNRISGIFNADIGWSF